MTITIFGEKGNTGSIKLSNSQNNFERNQKDVFEYFGISIGKIQKITIGHDGWGLKKLSFLFLFLFLSIFLFYFYFIYFFFIK